MWDYVYFALNSYKLLIVDYVLLQIQVSFVSGGVDRPIRLSKSIERSKFASCLCAIRHAVHPAAKPDRARRITRIVAPMARKVFFYARLCANSCTIDNGSVERGRASPQWIHPPAYVFGVCQYRVLPQSSH